MMRTSDLGTRDVVNVLDGRRLGTVSDIEIDMDSGRITAVVVPGAARLLGVLGRGDDYVIPWEKIKKIGPDVILVELASTLELRSRRG
ncbi:MAG: YlmC/YmxH family sporulation protein [Ignavibacteriales bacterium]